MNRTSGRDSKLKLSLDLLRNGCDLELVKSDVSAVEGLEDDVASVRSGFARTAGELEHVLVHLTLGLGLVSLHGVALSFTLALCILGWSSSICSASVDEGHALRTREEGVADFDLEELVLNRHRLSSFEVSLLLSQLLLVLLLGRLIHDGLFSCLKLLVLVGKYLLEGQSLLRVAVTCEDLLNLGQLSLTDDSVLQLSNSLICEDDVTLVDTELEGQEKDGHVRICSLSDLDRVNMLAAERLRGSRFLLIALSSLLLLLVLGILLSLFGGLVPLVDNLNVEDDILRERIVQVNIDLSWFVQLSSLVVGVD